MENKIKHILIVGGGSKQHAQLRALGVRTSVITRAPVLQWVHEIGENISAIVLPDNASLDQWLHYARAINALRPLDNVISLAEIDQDKAAAISEDLGLFYHSQETISWVHDKHLMRKRLAEQNVENIPNALVSTPDEVLAFGTIHKYPLIIKPSKGRASTGVSVVHTPDNVYKAFDHSQHATAPRLEPSTLLVEPFLEGREVSIEALSENGRHCFVAMVDKYKEEHTKVELGHAIPARISPAIRAEIEQHLTRVLNALNIRFGITHTEIMLTETGPRVIETHVRQAGDEIASLVKDVYDIDMPSLLLEHLAGHSILEKLQTQILHNQNTNREAAIWFAHLDVTGELQAIEGIEEVQKLPGIREVSPILKPGSQLHATMSSSYSRVTYVRSLTQNEDSAIKLAQEASQKLKFHFITTDRGRV